MRRSKTVVLAIAIMIFYSTWSLAQITAGSIPAGTSVYNPGINLETDSIFEEDTASFDIDCDGVNDIRLTLYKGPTIIDGANVVSLFLLNSSLEICTDTGYYSEAHFYNFGDSLNCIASEEWISDSISYLSSFGCFGCIGPGVLNDVYVQYKLGSSIGWIKVSFDIDDITPELTATVSEVLQLCTVTGEIERPEDDRIFIYPNPTMEGIIQLEGGKRVASVQLYNVAGQRMDVQLLPNNQIKIPNEKGLYALRVIDVNQKIWRTTVLKQ